MVTLALLLSALLTGKVVAAGERSQWPSCQELRNFKYICLNNLQFAQPRKCSFCRAARTAAQSVSFAVPSGRPHKVFLLLCRPDGHTKCSFCCAARTAAQSVPFAVPPGRPHKVFLLPCRPDGHTKCSFCCAAWTATPLAPVCPVVSMKTGCKAPSGVGEAECGEFFVRVFCAVSRFLLNVGTYLPNYTTPQTLMYVLCYCQNCTFHSL